MRFSDVQHQERALAIVRRALRSGRTHHAYLFAGPDGVGKELAGRALAARLLCTGDQAADADACGQCPPCQLLASGNHPDFHVIDRALRKAHPERSVRESKGLYLTVDLVRHFVIEPATLRPTQGVRRVFLIREAERMNEGAQNALLKTLEEPPGAACFVLVSASAERLLATIRSRCQIVPFDRLPGDFVTERLAQAGVDAQQAAFLAAVADGRLGLALHWHRAGVADTLPPLLKLLHGLRDGDVETFGAGLVEEAKMLATRLADAGSETDDDADADGEDDGSSRSSGKATKDVATDALRDALKLTYALSATVYRDALLTHAGVDELRLRISHEGMPGTANVGAAEHSLHALHEAAGQLDRNVTPQLVCERLGVALLGEAGNA